MNSNITSALVMALLIGSMASTAIWGFSIHPDTRQGTQSTTVNPNPQQVESPSTTILTLDGPIDNVMVYKFVKFFQANPQHPSILIVKMNSSGGDFNTVDGSLFGAVPLMGKFFKDFESQGTRVIFIAESRCVSGCFLLSTFASETYIVNGTEFWFHHPYEEVEAVYPHVSYILFLNKGIQPISFRSFMADYLTPEQAMKFNLIDGVIQPDMLDNMSIDN